MELHLTPETEAKLNELARRTRRGAGELLEEAVDHLISYNEWFEHKVRDSQAAVVRGETIPDEDVRAWIEARERRSSSCADRVVVVRCRRPAGITEWIEQDKGIETANRIARRIYEAVQSLRKMPYRSRYGRVEDTRELIITPLPCLIVYQISAERVVILILLHGAQR